MRLKGTYDAHMSPKYRCGHTSSQWRQERGPECKTSSNSWIVGIFLILLDSSAAYMSFFSSAGFVSFPILVSCGSQLSKTKIGFLSVIPKMKRRGTSLKTKPCYSLLPSHWKTHQSKFDCHKQVVQFGRACQLLLVKMRSQ